MSDKTPSNSAIQLQPFGRENIAEAHAISRSFGWRHRPEDWKFLADLGQGYVATDENKKTAGAGLLWPYGNQFATLGMLVVSGDKQRQGIGLRVMNALMQDAGDRSIILNATEAGTTLYQSLGFKVTGTIEQHQGIANAEKARSVVPDGAIEKISQGDLPAVGKMDEMAAGMPRLKLIQSLFREGQGLMLKKDGEIVGFAFRRDFGLGSVIGPVVAQKPADAIALIAAHVPSAKDGFVRLDLPVQQTKVIHWLEDAGMPSAGTATTMVKGTPATPSGKHEIFAVSSQALG